jgi:hypothetical protein
MTKVVATLRRTLLAMQKRDLSLRDELAADGSLYQGYHPRMEEVHRANAQQLRTLIERHGWPHEQLAGVGGAQAAWLIAQHAIAEPEFMRTCRDWLHQECQAGRVPDWQFAYLDDRIRILEGRAQCFGTQFEFTPDGPQLYPVEAPETLDERRLKVGLGPVAERLQSIKDQPRPSVAQFAEHKEQALAWRQKVGWTGVGTL